MPEQRRRPPQPMSETVRSLRHIARTLRTGGGREGRLGRILIVVGLALIVLAVVGPIVTSL